MQRRTIDTVVSGAGLVLAAVLIVFGVYFNDRYEFAQNNVHDQLTDQKIFFKDKALLTPEERAIPGLEKYAGQPVDDGEKARVYSEMIALHISETEGADGKTYAELGTPQRELQAKVEEARVSNDPALADLEQQLADLTRARDTVFKGETLRGILLTTYGFWQFGQEAQLAMYVSFAAAGILALLALLGFYHALRTRPSEELWPTQVPREERVLEHV